MKMQIKKIFAVLIAFNPLGYGPLGLSKQHVHVGLTKGKLKSIILDRSAENECFEKL